jgi:glucose-1-phosphate thymidylyltransferase
MKAIITAAGLGARSGLNGIIRKELLNIYDYRNGALVLRPIIDVLIRKLNELGIKEIAVVLDPNDIFAKNYLQNAYPSVSLFYQKERNGFGDAVISARDFVGDEGFVVAAGDGLILDFRGAGKALLDSAKEGRWTLFVMRVKEPRRYGVAVLDRQRLPYRVMGVVEKPTDPPSDYALCAFYYLHPQIFNYIDYKDGKAELTDAIGNAIKSGIEFSAVEIAREYWISVGNAEDYRTVLKTTYNYSAKKS